MSGDNEQVHLSVHLRPLAEEVERLYLAAAAGPPLREGPDTAAMFAGLYARSCEREDLIVVTAADEQLVGLTYGHPWFWDEQQDDWALQLRDQLGAQRADLIDGALAVSLLAVHPRNQRGGLGETLLTKLLTLGGARAWLQTTDIDSPARRMYARLGWVPIGLGPPAPNGKPGLVLASAALADQS